MKRAVAFLTFAVGILTLAPVSGLAAELDEGFNISISAGSANRTFTSSPFDLFDPSLGTLQSVTEFVSGSVAWDPGDDPGQNLFVGLGEVESGGQQSYPASATGGDSDIHIDLGGPVDPLLYNNKETFRETLEISQFPGAGTISDGTLIGMVTFIYAPAVTMPPSVPEPSTWAMMLVGFAGLGYAAIRRRRISSGLGPMAD